MMYQRIQPAQFFACIATFIFVAFPCIETVNAKSGGKGGGSKPVPSEYVPMFLEQEYYFFRVAGEDSCLGEDDQLEWTASGSLAPGESFSFTPQKAACKGHPAAISVMASWGGGTLELSSTVPDADLASLDAEQAGQDILAPAHGLTAQLCMFPAYNSDGVDYTITLSNSSSETVHDIQLRGQSRNDWAIHYYPNCINADADNDGWNDSLEHSMTNLLYPNSYINGVFQPDILWGSNYLRKKPRTASVDDEIDSYPPDFNDDGQVDNYDLLILDAWMGQGNGVALEQIDPDPGMAWYHNNTFPWRRFDLDGDGFVGEEDHLIVTQVLDQPVPMPADIITPTGRITAPLDRSIVPRGAQVMIKAHAWDNSSLTRVDYLVNGRTVCSKTSPIPDFGFTSPLYYCWWDTPKRSRSYLIEVRVHDAAGNTTLSEAVLVTSQ